VPKKENVLLAINGYQQTVSFEKLSVEQIRQPHSNVAVYNVEVYIEGGLSVFTLGI